MNLTKPLFSFLSRLDSQIDFDKKPMFTLLVSAHFVILGMVILKIIDEGLI